MTYTYPQLDTIQVDTVVNEINHYGLSNGLVMYKDLENLKNETAVAPVTLYPTILPKENFEGAVLIQKAYNELYANILLDDSNWLDGVIKSISEFDSDFTGKLYGLYLRFINDGVYKKQNKELGIFRNDFLLHENEDKSCQLKEVEFNTISVSFGALSSKVSALHHFLNENGHYKGQVSSSFDSKHLDIPISQSLASIASNIKLGVETFEVQQSISKSIVLFVVQPNERNVFDQRLIEYELFNKYKIKSKRITIDEVDKFINKKNDSYLRYNDDVISVVYFRSCYSPNDFKFEKSWDNRLFLETSLAIKAPSLKMQLAGSKKIQQLVTTPETLKRFIPNEDTCNNLLSTFVKIYPLDDSAEGRYAKNLIKQNNPDVLCKFVLKPQREGGGNNIYKSDIHPFLTQNIPNENDWAAYILMELINAQPTKGNVILRNNELHNVDILSELGIFGTVLIDTHTKKIEHNSYDGWLLRSKVSDSNEGGVAAGFGCVDSIALM
ncbi:related to Glutathione synthetase [Hanseniaspora guilliermondii]|uniref:Glutathione synthetase n=1 Tax=Hanseniaspora guilliermondii TaxID=56406 RepID=A0A1L0AY61_9ASCO|nr:related to Glutathione synthetase [Hanseniaspora guilliermondii]